MLIKFYYLFSSPPQRSRTRGFGFGHTRGFGSEPSSSFKSRYRGIDDLPGIKHLSITKRLTVVWTPKWFPSLWNALSCRTDTLVGGQPYLRPPSQNPAFLNSQSNSVFLHSGKQAARVTSSFLTSRGCPRVPRVSSHESFHCIQLFWERLSEKVHATIPKGIVGGFEFAVLQRNLKEWHERPWTYVCAC